MNNKNKAYKAYIESPYRSIKHTTYFDVYEKIFAPYAGKEITFLEIGVLDGGSLFMWRDFLGSQARIIGVDLNPGAARWRKDGFEIHIGSQSDPDFWTQVVKAVGDIDVVLDDGGHTYEQQIVTAECLLPHIKDGGMLVVEDTHTSYMPGFGPRSRSFIKYATNMVHRINKRCSYIASGSLEERVWGIKFYESFVIFDVDRKAASLKSQPTDNGKKSFGSADFRSSGSSAYPISYIKNLIKLKKYFAC